MKLKSKKKIASRILKTGVGRVWIDPERAEDVDVAITREEIRRLIHEMAIQARPKQGISRSRTRKTKKKIRNRGEGRKKGKKTSKSSSKDQWILKVRSQREKLRKMRENREISTNTYRQLYNKIKGGIFEDVSHLQEYIETHRLFKRK
jgi:large subunit ribosomal protein L19e